MGAGNGLYDMLGAQPDDTYGGYGGFFEKKKEACLAKCNEKIVCSAHCEKYKLCSQNGLKNGVI